MQDGLQEADIARLLFSGKIDAETICRRHGSPNWFRVAELFPHLKTGKARAAHHANLETSRSLSLKSGLLLLLVIGGVGSLFYVAAQKAREISAAQAPPSHSQP